MKRYEDWAHRLEHFLRENRTRAFQYGDWDCCLFVCDCIEAMTDADPAESFRGRYRSAKEARAFGSVAAIAERVSAEHGMPEVPPSFASRGDVVLIKRPRDYSLAIVALNGREALALSRNGIAVLPLSSASRAWKV